MKYFIKPLFVALLFMLSCADEANVSPAEDEYFMELKMGTSTYRISSHEYELSNREGKLVCADAGYVDGYRKVLLEDTSEKMFIRSLEFTLGKKTSKDELNLKDALSYTEKVVTAERFAFPVNQNGFEVSRRNTSAEAYLSLSTADGLYRSTSVVPNTRDESSFISIDKVVENKGVTAAEYPYLVEGRFMVNLFKGMYGTTSEKVEGKFRWPVSSVPTSELVALCE
jgi:hypothetical protein